MNAERILIAFLAFIFSFVVTLLVRKVRELSEQVKILYNCTEVLKDAVFSTRSDMIEIMEFINDLDVMEEENEHN